MNGPAAADEFAGKPKPGSAEAVAAGCICPVMDNCRGRGYFGDGARYGWVITEGCPVHPWTTGES